MKNPIRRSPFRSSRRVPKSMKSKIMMMARKDYMKTQAYMRPVSGKNREVPNQKVKDTLGNYQRKQYPLKNMYIGQQSAKIVNLASISKGDSMSNCAREPKPEDTKQSTRSEKQQTLPRSIIINGIKEPNSLRKPKVINRPQPTICMVPKDSYTAEGNTRQDGIATNKEKVMDHMNGNHSMNLTFDNAEKEGFAERQIANSNGKPCNYMSKKRKEFCKDNPKMAGDNDSEVGVQVDNMQTKKLQRSRVTGKDEEAEDSHGDLNHMGVEDDSASTSKNNHAEVIVTSCVEGYCCSMPIDKPSWSGIFKTDGKEYVSLVGHLSTKSCEKAWSLSRQLLPVVEVKKLSRLEVWPKSWETSKPTGDNIGIYFFPHVMRQDEDLDKLVTEVMENDLALRAIIGEAEMLIFPSILLPKRLQTFQNKHYLWGVFKRRQENGVVVEKPLLDAIGRCAQAAEKEKQHKDISDQPNHNASRLKGPTKKDFDPKAPKDGTHSEATHVATDSAALPASHGQISPSMGHPPSRLVGFIARQTPKLDHIIREIEREGMLVFAMQGEMLDAGTWAGKMATAMQK